MIILADNKNSNCSFRYGFKQCSNPLITGCLGLVVFIFAGVSAELIFKSFIEWRLPYVPDHARVYLDSDWASKFATWIGLLIFGITNRLKVRQILILELFSAVAIIISTILYFMGVGFILSGLLFSKFGGPWEMIEVTASIIYCFFISTFYGIYIYNRGPMWVFPDVSIVVAIIFNFALLIMVPNALMLYDSPRIWLLSLPIGISIGLSVGLFNLIEAKNSEKAKDQ